MGYENTLKDYFTGKAIEIGHIVAVRYVWNSYVGVVRLKGLSLHESAMRHAGAAAHHSMESRNTHQILGHIDPSHEDYNPETYKWLKSEEGECPVTIRVYENLPEIPVSPQS